MRTELVRDKGTSQSAQERRKSQLRRINKKSVARTANVREMLLQLLDTQEELRTELR